jgi:hypothetical protein
MLTTLFPNTEHAREFDSSLPMKSTAEGWAELNRIVFDHSFAQKIGELIYFPQWSTRPAQPAVSDLGEAWSKPFHGITHLSVSGKRSWVTVTDWDNWASLTRWYPGCGFSPLETQHGSADEAKRAAEAWLKDAV